MLVSECQRNNSRNQAVLHKQNIRADAAGVVAAGADAAGPRRFIRFPSQQRQWSRRRNNPNRQFACRKCRCAPRRPNRTRINLHHLPLPRLLRLPPLPKFRPKPPPPRFTPPSRKARPSARRFKKSGELSSPWSRRWKRWRKCCGWWNRPSTRNLPTNASLNRCAARCINSSRHTGSGGNLAVNI